MKKLLLKVGIVAGIGLVLLVVAGVVLFGPTSRKVIEKGTSYALGVDASLGKVDAGVGVDSSHLGIVDFDVKNPEGFGDESFLSVGELGLDLRTMSVLSQTVRVPSITLDGLHLRLVQNGTRSNFGEIMEHVRSLSSGADDAAAEEPQAEAPAEKDGAGPLLMVDTIDLRGIQLSIDVEGIPGVDFHETFTAPDLHLDVAKTIEEAGGMSLGDLTGYVVDKLLAHGIEEVGDDVSPEIASLLQGGLTGGLEGLTGQLEARATEEVDKLKDKAQEELQEGADELRSKVDGIKNEGEAKVKDALNDLFGDG